jgi:hypothetical protein
MIIGAVKNEYGYRRKASGSTPRQAIVRTVAAALTLWRQPFTSYNKASMPCSPVDVISVRSSAVCKPICGGEGATPTGGAQHTLLKRCTQYHGLLKL